MMRDGNTPEVTNALIKTNQPLKAILLFFKEL